jgi:hypothetical protein
LYISILLWLVVVFLQAVSFIIAAEAIRTDSIPVVEAKWNWLLTLLFFGDAALDVTTAAILCFYLKKRSRTSLSKT